MNTDLSWELKKAICRSEYRTQIGLSQALGIREARLSYLLNGHSKPTAAERRALALALGKDYFAEE